MRVLLAIVIVAFFLMANFKLLRYFTGALDIIEMGGDN